GLARDRARRRDADNRDDDVGARRRAVAELPVTAVAPAIDPAGREQCAVAVVTADDPRRVRQAGDRNGRVRARVRTVSELAVAVVTPAFDAAARAQRAVTAVHACDTCARE